MPKRSGDALTKTTLNLFTSDIAILRSRYGHGWSEQVRRLVHQDCVDYRKFKRELNSPIVREYPDAD